MNWPRTVLMVTPNGFRVEYAINPYMLDSNGNLQNINSLTALKQWTDIKGEFERLGLRVEIVEGRDQFPDMVFCANQTLPVLDQTGAQHLVLSRMNSPQRAGEVPFFKEWADARGTPVFTMTDFNFEGGGDAIWNYETGELFGGHGFRTDPRAYEALEQRFGLQVCRLQLVNEDFYHLDTCLAILNGTTVALVREAFDEKSLKTIESKFTTIIEIDPVEARKYFAGNCVSVDGKNVILQKGSHKLVADLKRHGFKPIEVDTSEFIKAGGSAFCIKQLLFT